jgi:hypothetical protein
MRTIAEWAEDRMILQTLADLGADYAQGWAIAKPQSPERILAVGSAADFIVDPATLQTVRDCADDSRWSSFKERLLPLHGLRSSDA